MSLTICGSCPWRVFSVRAPLSLLKSVGYQWKINGSQLHLIIRAISEMMQISYDFSKGANSSSSGPGEEVKKENHQNLTPQMIGKSNSVQLRMFGRKRALIFTRKMVKNFIRLLWSVHRKNSPWTWPANGQTRLVLLRNDQNKIINQQNRNIISTISIFAKTRFFLRHPVYILYLFRVTASIYLNMRLDQWKKRL